MRHVGSPTVPHPFNIRPTNLAFFVWFASSEPGCVTALANQPIQNSAFFLQSNLWQWVFLSSLDQVYFSRFATSTASRLYERWRAGNRKGNCAGQGWLFEFDERGSRGCGVKNTTLLGQCCADVQNVQITTVDRLGHFLAACSVRKCRHSPSQSCTRSLPDDSDRWTPTLPLCLGRWVQVSENASVISFNQCWIPMGTGRMERMRFFLENSALT